MVARIEDRRRTHKWTTRQIHLELVRGGHQIARWLRRLVISRRRDIDPTGSSNWAFKTITARYPGHLVHLDVKRVGRITDGDGWRTHGRDSDQAKAVEHAKTKRARSGYVYCALPWTGSPAWRTPKSWPTRPQRAPSRSGPAHGRPSLRTASRESPGS